MPKLKIYKRPLFWILAAIVLFGAVLLIAARGWPTPSPPPVVAEQALDVPMEVGHLYARHYSPDGRLIGEDHNIPIPSPESLRRSDQKSIELKIGGNSIGTYFCKADDPHPEIPGDQFPVVDLKAGDSILVYREIETADSKRAYSEWTKKRKKWMWCPKFLQQFFPLPRQPVKVLMPVARHIVVDPPEPGATNPAS